jgi:hypothetical protein
LRLETTRLAGAPGRTTGLGLAAMSAALWAIGGIAAQDLFARHHVDPGWLAGVRMACGGLLLAVFSAVAFSFYLLGSARLVRDAGARGFGDTITAQPAGCGYGRRVMDLDQGWRTERLELEPLTVEHAADLAPVLDDAALHEFTGGAPLAPAALTARYARLAERRSPDGHQLWGRLNRRCS